MVQHFGPLALVLMPVAAFLGRLVALARQFAQLFFALSHVAAAIAVSFVLARRRPVGDLPDGFHRRRDHRLHRAEAAGKQGEAQCRNDQDPHIYLLARALSSHKPLDVNRILRREETSKGASVTSLK